METSTEWYGMYNKDYRELEVEKRNWCVGEMREEARMNVYYYDDVVLYEEINFDVCRALMGAFKNSNLSRTWSVHQQFLD